VLNDSPTVYTESFTDPHFGAKQKNVRSNTFFNIFGVDTLFFDFEKKGFSNS